MQKQMRAKLQLSMEDNLEDVLNMLDDDAELAEINDMLKNQITMSQFRMT